MTIRSDNNAILPDSATLLEDVERIAREAGDILLGHFDRLAAHAIERKTGHRDLLTVADAEAERHVINAVRGRFPRHAILGEENGFIPGAAPLCWVIDPLDGTTNFARSFPVFAVSIGVLEHGRPYAGVVFAPRLGECFAAARGGGAWLNGKRLRVSETPDLKHSMLATGFSYNRNEVVRNNVDNFSNLILNVHDIRRAGAASVDLAYVAAGRFDGYWEAYLKPWDVAAGGLLVTEAGGQITDYAGNPSPDGWLWEEHLVASNGRVHEALRSVLSGVEHGYAPGYRDIGARVRAKGKVKT